jgi:hypothetical protein
MPILAYKDQAQTISASHTFSGSPVFTGTVTFSGVLNVTGTVAGAAQSRVTWEGICTSLNNTGETYLALNNMVGAPAVSDLARLTTMLMVRPAIIDTFAFSVDAAPGVGKSWTLVVKRSAPSPIDTPVSAVISGTGLYSGVSTGSFAVSPGDFYAIKMIPAGSPSGSALIWTVSATIG